MKQASKLGVGALVGILFGLASGAHAATHTWDLDSGSVGVGSGGYASAVNYTYGSNASDGNSMDMVVSGWAASGTNGAIENWDECLRHWSGLSLDRSASGGGCATTSGDQHTIDNNGPDEFVVFAFEEAISFDQFTYGYVWQNSSADTTVLYYDPNVGPGTAPDLTGQTLNDMNTDGGNVIASSITNNGWTALAHYADVPANTPTSTGSSVLSSFWAIGGYMVNISAPIVSGLYAGTDGFKLSSIGGSTANGGQVPTPSPIWLLLFAVPWLRKRVDDGRWS